MSIADVESHERDFTRNMQSNAMSEGLAVRTHRIHSFQAYAFLSQVGKLGFLLVASMISREMDLINIETFWSLLKPGVVGTFHQVSKEYLPLSWRNFPIGTITERTPTSLRT